MTIMPRQIITMDRNPYTFIYLSVNEVGAARPFAITAAGGGSPPHLRGPNAAEAP